MINLCGPMVALLTPFKIDNTVDFKAFDQLIDFHAWSGTTAVVVASAIGEAQTLSIEEHSALYRAAVQRADGRIATIAGIECQSTRTACQFACEAAIANDFLSAEPNPIPAKFLVGEMGLMRSNVRPPLATSSELASRFATSSGAHRWTGSVSYEEVG
ncbi:dihydrodipicolinate synthase family protein [Paraburkholderia sp. IMGN_8]|uniref:dihydrodipicolinate synthase family protein n=1 Tax=Paraburkholderia sp. IMGN_8 TaxID=3136564 RepID=UPI0031018DC8